MDVRRLQNYVHRTDGNFTRSKAICELHVTFKIPHFYDFIRELYSSSKQKSYKITKIQIYAKYDTAKPNTGSLRG